MRICTYHLHVQLHSEVAVRSASAATRVVLEVLDNHALYIVREATACTEVREYEVVITSYLLLLLEARNHCLGIVAIAQVEEFRYGCEDRYLIESYLIHIVSDIYLQVAILVEPYIYL